MLVLGDCAGLVTAGPKARRLAQARRAGLPVPDGLVLLPDAPLPTEAELMAALGALAGAAGPTAPGPRRWVVRSSALAEDLAGHSAAGLFRSVVGVTQAKLLPAIQAVRDSGDSELVRLALGGPVPVAVLIQPLVDAARLGVLYRSQLGELRCEERDAGAPEWSEVTVSHYGPSERGPLPLGAEELARLVEAESQSLKPAAIYAEYAVAASGQVTFLQVRPAPLSEADDGFVLPGDKDLIYTLDHEHNPDPLSAAQQGLVTAVADLVPWLLQRSVRGYLYVATSSAAGRPAQSAAPLTRESFTTSILPACEAVLGPP